MNASDKMASVKNLATRFSRLSKLTIMILVVVGGLWLAGSFSSTRDVPPALTGKYPSSVSQEHAVHPAVPQKQVVVRTIPTNTAGLGSVVAQLRSSAAIATMLGAGFHTFGLISTHLTQYRAASLLRLDLLDTRLDPETKVCSIASSPHQARTVELMESWCNNVTLGDAHALELQGLWSDCGLILDDRPWDVRYDMSKCTWRWMKHVFSKLGFKSRRRGIGLHKRWGDVSNMWVPPQRSTPIDLAARLIGKLRECGVQDELSVYMEWHNDTMLNDLGEPYRLVDTGDSIDDLLDLAANRLMILDISSWTVMAHEIAEGGITLVPDVDGYDGHDIRWHNNGMNHVLRWSELLSISCSDFSRLLDS